MDEKLIKAYGSFFQSVSRPQALASRLSLPLLLASGPKWQLSRRRVLFVGQETLDWRWPDRGLETLTDFFACNDPVREAVTVYSAFDFAAHNPISRRSPFWRAFHLLRQEINGDGTGDLLWTNLFRCALDRGSVVALSTPGELEQILEFQRGLLRLELSVLKPTAVLFFTGPYYDGAVAAEFPGCVIAPAGNHQPREFAQVIHPELPLTTFRTYHPASLVRSPERWSWLHELAESVTA